MNPEPFFRYVTVVELSVDDVIRTVGGAEAYTPKITVTASDGGTQVSWRAAPDAAPQIGDRFEVTMKQVGS